MTDLREAAQMALEALQESKPIDIDDPAAFYRSAHAIEALRAELAQPEKKSCWCETCRPITMQDMRMVLCPTCGNKRCPHATDHRNACTGSNEPGQAGSSYGGLAQPEQEPVAQVQVAEDYYPHVVFLDGVDTTSLDQKFLYTAPPQREPILCGCGDQIMPDDGAECGTCVTARNATQREWQGLTDEEYATLLQRADYDAAKTGSVFQNLRRAIEAKLKEKNNG